MSICPTCGKRVKMSSGNKKKVNGVWVHKHSSRRRREVLDLDGLIKSMGEVAKAASVAGKAIGLMSDRVRLV